MKIKRVYEPFSKSDGHRILIDRLWPRGIKKENAHVDQWMKEVAPSNDLREWFNHEPEKWEGFMKKYQSELKKSAAFQELIAEIGKHKTVTLLYSAKDEQHNNAKVVKQFLQL